MGLSPAWSKVCLGYTTVRWPFDSFIQQLGSSCSVPVFLSLENAGLVLPLKGLILEPCRPHVALVSLGFSASRWVRAVARNLRTGRVGPASRGSFAYSCPRRACAPRRPGGVSLPDPGILTLGLFLFPPRKGPCAPPTPHPNHLRASHWKDFGNYLFQLSCFQSRLG